MLVSVVQMRLAKLCVQASSGTTHLANHDSRGTRSTSLFNSRDLATALQHPRRTMTLRICSVEHRALCETFRLFNTQRQTFARQKGPSMCKHNVIFVLLVYRLGTV